MKFNSITVWVFADHKWPKSRVTSTRRRRSEFVFVSARFFVLIQFRPINDSPESNKYRTVRWSIGKNFLLILDNFSLCSTSTVFAHYRVLQNGGRHASKHTTSVHAVRRIRVGGTDRDLRIDSVQCSVSAGSLRRFLCLCVFTG